MILPCVFVPLLESVILPNGFTTLFCLTIQQTPTLAWQDKIRQTIGNTKTNRDLSKTNSRRGNIWIFKSAMCCIFCFPVPFFSVATCVLPREQLLKGKNALARATENQCSLILPDNTGAHRGAAAADAISVRTSWACGADVRDGKRL